MNFLNASLQTIATSLVVLGVTTIASSRIDGVVEILLGLAIYLVYELTPTKPN